MLLACLYSQRYEARQQDAAGGRLLQQEEVFGHDFGRHVGSSGRNPGSLFVAFNSRKTVCQNENE
ncbi:MAG TPA: hypothetical protein VNO32_48960 [Candidatus Acidoferrum sp.]|nr:hypothetical protein [Candidatus Acidoferrum sp.]